MQEESFTNIESPSLQFLPRRQEAAGWQLDEDPIVIPGDRLQSYLDAGAEHFTGYEVIDATIGEYSAVGAEGFATVEIYRFPDFVKAFGAYSIHKQGPIEFVPIENEAFRSKHGFHLWRGPFYVRVVGGGSQQAGAGLLPLLQFVAQRMPTAPSKPAVFNFFPTETRVPNSERYSADEGLGQAVLGNSFQATFNVGGDVMEGLIIPAANKQTATRILNTYRDLYVRNGKLLDPIPNLGEDNFTGEDRYLGRAVVFRLDRFVLVFHGFRDRTKLIDLAIATDARILKSIQRQLQSVDQQQRAQSQGRSPAQQEENAPPWATGTAP